MKTKWKFWQKWQRGGRDDQTSADAFDQESTPGGFSLLLSQSSPQEILGLQKLIGNQAVLQILASDKVDTKATSA